MFENTFNADRNSECIETTCKLDCKYENKEWKYEKNK